VGYRHRKLRRVEIDDIVIDVDGDGVPVGIDFDSFASEIVDLTKLEAEGPVFGLARVGGPESRIG
jgi:hypothetical protein